METIKSHEITTERQWCDHCGASLKKYKVVLNKALAQTLIKLRRLQHETGEQEIHLEKDDRGSKYQLTENERRNMSRLRFLGLARYTESHSGKWFITRRGYQFLNGESVPKFVWIFRNKIVEDMRTSETITLSEVFRRDDIPYFEPVTDQMFATSDEQNEAVERRKEQESKHQPKKTSVECANPNCDNRIEVEMSFGSPLTEPIVCSQDCKDMLRKGHK